MFNGVELCGSSQHDDGTWFSVIAGPASKPGEDRCGVGEGALGRRIFLFCGFALEAFADPLERRHVIGIEGIGEGPASASVAPGHELHHRDGGDQDGCDQLLQWPVLLWRKASMRKPLVFMVRNTCSMVQRLR